MQRQTKKCAFTDGTNTERSCLHGSRCADVSQRADCKIVGGDVSPSDCSFIGQMNYIYSKTRPIRLDELTPIKKWWKKRTESDVCWKVDIKTIIERNYDLDIKNPTKQEEAHEYNSAELMEMLHQSFDKSNALLKELKKTI